MKSILTMLLLLFTALSFSHTVFATKLYKWVDQNGNISYQDTPPPDNAKVLEESSFKRGTTSEEPASESTPVTVYTVENCDACEMLLLRLQQLDIPHEVESLLNKDVQAEIMSVHDALTAPTLKIGDRYVVDLTDEGILNNLQEAGFNPNDGSAAKTNE